LTHGRFVPTQDLGQQPGQSVDGRRLNVTVKAQQIQWETVGYSDTRHMPVLPPQLHLVATFTSDEHVRPLLDKWSVGWDAAPMVPAGELAYNNGCDLGMTGYSAVPCGTGSNANCDIGNGKTTQACSGSSLPAAAAYYVQTGPSTGIGDFCCGTFSTGQYASKSCNSIGVCSNNARAQCTRNADCPSSGTCLWTSACGTAMDTVKCMVCPGAFTYYTNGSCSVWANGGGGLQPSICHYFCSGAEASPCVSDDDCCNGGACMCGECRHTRLAECP
jgi:hypothetical protein